MSKRQHEDGETSASAEKVVKHEADSDRQSKEDSSVSVKAEKEEVKSENQSVEEELALLEQFLVVDEDQDDTMAESVDSQGSGGQWSVDSGAGEALNEVASIPHVVSSNGNNLVVKNELPDDLLLPPGVDSSSDLLPSVPAASASGPHGYAGFQDTGFAQKLFCLAVADPTPASGKVMPKTLSDDVITEERRRLEERDEMELYVTHLPPSFQNQALWRLDAGKNIKGVYRCDFASALLIFANKEDCKRAYPGIRAKVQRMHQITLDRVGKGSGGHFRRTYPYDDISTLPAKANSLALCIMGVLHGATDILHKINELFAKAATIHYPMTKGRRGRPVFVYFMSHSEALEAFWAAKKFLVTKYPITVIFARVEPLISKTPWPEMTRSSSNERPRSSRDRKPAVKDEKEKGKIGQEKYDRAEPKRDFGRKKYEDRKPDSRAEKQGGRDYHNHRDEKRPMRNDDKSSFHKRSITRENQQKDCGECERLRMQRNEAENMLNAAHMQIKEMEAQLVQFSMENDALKKESGKRDKEHWLLRQSLDDSLKRVTTAEIETRDLQKTNDDMRDRLNYERETWKKKLDELEFELRRMEEYKQKFDELQASHAKLRDYDWLDKEYAKLRSENKGLLQENQKLFEQTTALHKALAGSNLPYEAYLDANQRAIQYLASSAQQYSEEVQQLRAERAKWLTGSRPDRIDRPITSTALDDAARKVAELQVTITRLEGLNRDGERKVESLQSMAKNVGAAVQTFDQCCVEIADMFAKCPLTIQAGSLETLSRPSGQDGSELAAKSRLLRGSLRDLLSYIKTLQAKLDHLQRQGGGAGGKREDPRLEHSQKELTKEVKVLNELLASKDAKIAQLELQMVMTQMRR